MLPAFPGAYGWGAESIGGRGGMVVPVTNLNDSGPGSFRAAMLATVPRTIVFLVAGIIDLLSPINLDSDDYAYCTIAGHTAPGSGIWIRSNGQIAIQLKTHNIIMLYLTYRGHGGAGEEKFLQLREGCHDSIFAHLSGSWAEDDLISANKFDAGTPDMHRITIQNWLFGYPNSDHKTSVLVASTPAFGETHHISVLGNLFSTAGHRCPVVMASEYVEVVNNGIYNWPTRAGSMSYADALPGSVEIDYINNYYFPDGASSHLVYYDDRFVTDLDDPAHSFYAAGNIVPVVPSGSLLSEPLIDPDADNWDLFQYQSDDSALNRVHERTIPLASPTYAWPLKSAQDAWSDVPNNAGNNARLNADGTRTVRRDSLDEQFIDEARNTSGPSSYPSIPGSMPSVDAGTAYIDTDGDGMSDEWELANGLDPDDPSDGPIIRANGYSNLEHFLNGMQLEQATGGGGVSVAVNINITGEFIIEGEEEMERFLARVFRGHPDRHLRNLQTSRS